MTTTRQFILRIAGLLPSAAQRRGCPGGIGTRLHFARLAEARLHLAGRDSCFLTHIHLDPAGAAVFLAGQGAQVFVHPVGAPHMLSPEKLIASAVRIYGDKMQTLRGDFLPVPAGKLTVLQDGEEVQVGSLLPRHAEQHERGRVAEVLE